MDRVTEIIIHEDFDVTIELASAPDYIPTSEELIT